MSTVGWSWFRWIEGAVNWGWYGCYTSTGLHHEQQLHKLVSHTMKYILWFACGDTVECRGWMVWEPTGRRSHNATMEIMPLWSEWRLNWWGRTFSSCVLVSDRCAFYMAGWSHHLTFIWVKRLNEKGWVCSCVSSYCLWHHRLWNLFVTVMMRWNGFTSGDFPSRSLLGLLAGTPQQDYLGTLKTTSLNQSTEESQSLIDRSSMGLRVWQWCETIRRPYMLGFFGRRVPTSLGSGVIITGMWWTRRSGGCLLISDWMMPSKQMSIWGIESAPRCAQWYSAARASGFELYYSLVCSFGLIDFEGPPLQSTGSRCNVDTPATQSLPTFHA